MITARGFELNLTTTTPALVNALIKDSNWVLARYGRTEDSYTGYSRYKEFMKKKHLNNASSCKRITYSFWYKSK